MTVTKKDSYNVKFTEVWSAPVGTTLIPLGEPFPEPEEGQKPLWKCEGTSRWSGFSEGVLTLPDGSEHRWTEMRAGTVRVTEPRMIVARGELENGEYDAQIVYYEVRHGVVMAKENGDPMVIFIKKKA